MIFGRPTNLVLGALTAVFNVIVVASRTVPGLENLAAILNDVLVPVINVALGAVILLIANQPPVLAPGDTFTKATPAGTPNETVTVET